MPFVNRNYRPKKTLFAASMCLGFCSVPGTKNCLGAASRYLFNKTLRFSACLQHPGIFTAFCLSRCTLHFARANVSLIHHHNPCASAHVAETSRNFRENPFISAYFLRMAFRI
jgi:hypothetical protein